MLLMYLQSMGSVLDLIRFLRSDPEWLVTLDLRKRVDGAMTYKIPDRTTFYKFAERLGPDKMIEVFAVMVVRLMQAGIIKGEKVSPRLLDHLGLVQGLQVRQQAQPRQQAVQAPQEEGQGRVLDVGPPSRDVRLRVQGPHRHRLALGPPHHAHRHEGWIRRRAGRCRGS